MFGFGKKLIYTPEERNEFVDQKGNGVMVLGKMNAEKMPHTVAAYKALPVDIENLKRGDALWLEIGTDSFQVSFSGWDGEKPIVKHEDGSYQTIGSTEILSRR